MESGNKQHESNVNDHKKNGYLLCSASQMMIKWNYIVQINTHVRKTSEKLNFVFCILYFWKMKKKKKKMIAHNYLIWLENCTD